MKEILGLLLVVAQWAFAWWQKRQSEAEQLKRRVRDLQARKVERAQAIIDGKDSEKWSRAAVAQAVAVRALFRERKLRSGSQPPG